MSTSGNLNTSKPQPRPRAPWHKRLFAAMMASNSTAYDELVANRKRALLGGLHGNVLEIGPGTGPNLVYFAPDVHWIGVESNLAMFSYLEREAERLGLTIDLREGTADHLPVDDNSMDAVVSTLVLCSIRDPAVTLKEVRRVLKPGGKFVFLEHVAAPRGTSTRRVQSFMRPVWQIIADNCHLDRETWTSIEQAGFSQLNLEHFQLPMKPTGPHISGIGIK